MGLSLSVIQAVKDHKIKLECGLSASEKIILEPVTTANLEINAERMSTWRQPVQDQFYINHPSNPVYWAEFIRRKYIDMPNALLFLLSGANGPFGFTSIYDCTDISGVARAEYGRTVRGVRTTGDGKLVSKGGMTVATRELLRFCFDNLELDEVFLEVFADNFKAQKMYYDAGFVQSSVAEPLMRDDSGNWVVDHSLISHIRKAAAYSLQMTARN
ncbi:MAG: GNAT family N-acetyltransferase [Nanoarchaeota archaeon]